MYHENENNIMCVLVRRGASVFHTLHSNAIEEQRVSDFIKLYESNVGTLLVRQMSMKTRQEVTSGSSNFWTKTMLLLCSLFQLGSN
jgi:hypothetical protein